MSFNMHFQSARSHERLVADFTYVRSRIRMLSLMICEMSLCGERSATVSKFTSEWFFTCMYPHMCFEISILCKTFTAILTLEWFLASMSSEMDLQSARSGVILTTDFAFERLFSSMYQQVSLQMTFGYERFITIFKNTVKWSISGMLSHVCFQIASFVELSHAV